MMSENEKDDGYIASCPHCDRKFTLRKNLYAHIRQFHPEKKVELKRKTTIICCVCEEMAPTISSYIDHIRSVHTEIQLLFDKKFFYSKEEFDAWKCQMEQETGNQFAIRISERKLSDERTFLQYRCERSGIFKSSVDNSKRKFAGSKKIGKTCPAYFSVYKTVKNDLLEMEVDFQTVHVGHKCDIFGSSRYRRRKIKLQNGAKICSNKNSKKPRSIKPRKDMRNAHMNKKSNVKVMSEILCHDPVVEIKKMPCLCKEYAATSMCDHLQTIYTNIKLEIPNRTVNSDDSNDILDSAYIAVDGIDMAEDPVNILKDANDNVILKTLEEQKSSIIAKFYKIVEKCENEEQMAILKDILEDCESRLSSTSEQGIIQSSPQVIYVQSSTTPLNVPVTTFPHLQNNWVLVQPSSHVRVPAMSFENQQNIVYSHKIT